MWVWEISVFQSLETSPLTTLDFSSKYGTDQRTNTRSSPKLEASNSFPISSPKLESTLSARASSELTLTRHVVFTSLASDQAALDVYGQLIKAASKLEPGSQVILVDQSTLHPDTASECYPVYSAADTAVGNTLMIRRYRKTSARGECECQDLVPHLPSYGSACRRSCQVDGMHSCW
jgi:hypothetical protein